MQINDGWDLDVGDLVTVLNGHFSGTIGIVTKVSVPQKQWFIHWLSMEKRIPKMCMYTYIKPVGSDNESR